MNQRFVVGGGEEEAAGFGVLESGQERIGERPRELEVAASPARLQEIEQRLGEKCVVIEVCLQVSPTVLVGREEPPIPPQGAMDEVDRAGRCVGEIGPVQDTGGDRQPGNREDQRRSGDDPLQPPPVPESPS